MMRLAKIGMVATLLMLSVGCTRTIVAPSVDYVAVETSQGQHIPGVVEYTYEEPMVDVVDVPAGLDAEGVYYIPPHQAVVEIRQGRWQYRPETGPRN